jgi:26S proteasome regulatory subunit T1
MQAIGGLAGMAEQDDISLGGMGVTDSMEGGGKDAGNLFGEIVGKGLQTGLGTIAGLGYG